MKKAELPALKEYPFTTRGIGTTPCLPTTFSKGDNFCDFLFAFVDCLFSPK